MQITAEQLAERDAWELALKTGKCTLHEALFMCLSSGAPATPYLLERLERAFASYVRGDCADLAEPFGLSLSKREKNSVRSEVAKGHIRRLVEDFHARGFPLTNPEQYPNTVTAFHKAAELCDKAVSTVFDVWRKA